MKNEIFYTPEMVRHDQSNHYRQFILDSKDGNYSLFKGNGYSATGEAVVHKILYGNYLYKVEAVFKDVDLEGTSSYVADALVVYKITKGNMLLLMENGKKIILSCGDIVYASSNFKMLKCHSFNKKVEYIGVMYYYKEMIEAIRNKFLDNSFLKELYNSKIIQNVFVNKGNYKINELFDEIEDAVNSKNEILIKAKSLELLAQSAFFYNNFISVGCENISEGKLKNFNDIKNFLDNNLDKYYSMEFIANKFSMSLSSLKKLFKEVYGISPYTYHLSKRLEKAKILLDETDFKMYHIYKSVGFDYYSNFSRAFQKKYNSMPSQYRKMKK